MLYTSASPGVHEMEGIIIIPLEGRRRGMTGSGIGGGGGGCFSYAVPLLAGVYLV